MQIQDFKRWHWALIAIVVGLALSYVWSSVEWDENLPTIGQREFENGLVIKYPESGHLENVTVMPPVEGKYKIVAEIVRNTKTPGVIDLRPVAYVASTPYVAGGWRGENESHPDVRQYLSKVQKDNPDTKFKYAWFRERWAIFTLWTGASLLLIGGVWPSVVSLMIGAGLGLKGEEKGPDYDLNRFKGETEAKKGKAEPTPEQIAHMRELEDELERKLAAQRAGLPIPEDEPSTTAAPGQPRKLDGGPLELQNVDKPAEDHEYKGEFYPVDRHLPNKKK